jgi:D-hexose-6-phosphate mutarotase
MVCVESANAMDDALTLEPGSSHELVTTVEVLPD